MKNTNFSTFLLLWTYRRLIKTPEVTLPVQKGVEEPHLTSPPDTPPLQGIHLRPSAMTISVWVGVGRLEMPRWWTLMFDWRKQPVLLVCIPGGCSLHFKLLPCSLLRQTDRYLLMNPHAPVTPARLGALGERPLLLSGISWDRVEGLQCRGGGKGQGRGRRVFKMLRSSGQRLSGPNGVVKVGKKQQYWVSI